MDGTVAIAVGVGLAAGVGEDPSVVIGETGIAAWAGFLAATCDENLRQQLGLDCSSRVVIIATEGATDPKVYHNLVGASPEAILAGTKPQSTE